MEAQTESSLLGLPHFPVAETWGVREVLLLVDKRPSVARETPPVLQLVAAHRQVLGPERVRSEASGEIDHHRQLTDVLDHQRHGYPDEEIVSAEFPPPAEQAPGSGKDLLEIGAANLAKRLGFRSVQGDLEKVQVGRKQPLDVPWGEERAIRIDVDLRNVPGTFIFDDGPEEVGQEWFTETIERQPLEIRERVAQTVHEALICGVLDEAASRIFAGTVHAVQIACVPGVERDPGGPRFDNRCAARVFLLPPLLVQAPEIGSVFAVGHRQSASRRPILLIARPAQGRSGILAGNTELSTDPVSGLDDVSRAVI